MSTEKVKVDTPAAAAPLLAVEQLAKTTAVRLPQMLPVVLSRKAVARLRYAPAICLLEQKVDSRVIQ